MEENRNSTVGRRAALLLHRLLVDVRRQYYKPTQGDNRGWRRSPLGGNHGNHFYAWWAPRGAAPLAAQEFATVPEGAIFLRDIRHHDDHRPLNPQSLEQNYLAIGVRELRQEDYVPAPWTTAQARFAQARQKVRIIKGFPGSGKTTALWHAADLAGRETILYITYSPELAALARDHFDKFAPGHKRFQVVTYAQLLRHLLGVDPAFEPLREARRAFTREIGTFSSTILGPWLNEKAALYDEMHAHLFGAVLPVPVGRFPGFPERRVSARQYREMRERAVGRAAAEAVVEVAETLRRRDSRPVEQRFFRELDLAWEAVQQLRSRGAGGLTGFDCVALDEAQDLTPIEAMVVVELAVALGRDTSLLVAGDEAQTIRPTDFEWGWFQDLVHHRLASPVEFKLQVNLRSPQRIASLVNRAWDLYGAIAKQERPGGSGIAEIDENIGDQVIHCATRPGAELEELLQAFAEREGLALIAMGEEIPEYVPERLRGHVLTTFEAKGLDFQSVCILDAGRWLDRVLQARDRGRGIELDDLGKRLAIDQLRVALSRPAERLYWLDVSPTERILANVQRMLSFEDPVWPVVPAVLLKTLQEEALDVEERVRLCESDARQFLEAKPALSWSRARQAVALLGEPGGKFSVTDPAARKSAHLTLCQVAFTLAFRRVSLPAEMGRHGFVRRSRQKRGCGGPAGPGGRSGQHRHTRAQLWDREAAFLDAHGCHVGSPYGRDRAMAAGGVAAAQQIVVRHAGGGSGTAAGSHLPDAAFALLALRAAGSRRAHRAPARKGDSGADEDGGLRHSSRHPAAIVGRGPQNDCRMPRRAGRDGDGGGRVSTGRPAPGSVALSALDSGFRQKSTTAGGHGRPPGAGVAVVAAPHARFGS